MNLRILKKLSKRAAPYLPLLGDTRKQFPAIPYDNYHGMIGFPRKNWERSRCHPTYEGWGDQIVRDTRAGHRIVMREPSHPLAGTIMVGSMEGYYEPEWDEQTAWGALYQMVFGHFTDWSAMNENVYASPVLMRKLDTPSQIFAAADELVLRSAG